MFIFLFLSKASVLPEFCFTLHTSVLKPFLFLQLLGKETEKFGGDTLLNGQEQLHSIKMEMDGWTDNAMMVFSRHISAEGNTHRDQANMLDLNDVSYMYITLL